SPRRGKMYRSAFVPLTLLALTFAVPMGQACPRTCNCYQANEVHCTFRSLLAIPSGLPVHTRRINLGFNSISRIHNSSLAGLKKAELLMLHSNDLHHLPNAAFRDMKSLQILKLSYNKLREIASSLTFSGLTSLLRLYLDHNLLQHIHPRALLQLTSLRLLRLQGNRLHQLHPHALCTLSLLNTYYFSTLRHLDLSNNSLTTLPRETLATAPLLDTLMLQDNPWSCDCKMRWFLTWSQTHPGPMKCPGSPQCPICASPNSLQGHGLLDQTDLLCTSPVITSPGRDTPLEAELGEIQSSESLRQPLGSASLGLSDQQGNSVDLGCNITHSPEFQDISPTPDLSLSSSSPIPLALSLTLECLVEKQSYETLWRILAYYSETAVRLEREIMLSKAPALAYRYGQAAETGGYYYTGVKASVQVRPQWLLQPAVSIQLNRARSNGHRVQLIYSTRVAARPDPPSRSDFASHPSTSSPPTPPWVLISTNHTITALAAVAGSEVELSCPLLSSGNPKVQWVLPDGSMISPSRGQNGRLPTSNYGLILQDVQLSESGIYHCIARAGSDVDVLHLRLAVEESSVPPLNEQVGPPVTGNVGEPITLSCKASGSPAPLMSWVLPDGNIVRQGLAVSGGLTIQSDGSLSLTSPSQRDVGNFRCIAVNHCGSDSLSMKLQSTKIRAPLLVEEGSGNEKEEEEIPVIGNSKRPRPLQPTPQRRHPIGKPRRPGPMRGDPLRRGGVPSTSNGQRRNRFDNRHRVTTNKQRIDPHKWADLLAKIRQKTVQTNNSQPIEAGIPTAEPQGRGEGGNGERHEGHRDAEGHKAEGAGVESENEGSSIDDTDLQEERLQHIQLTQIEMQPITSKPVSRTNEFAPGPGEGGEPGTNRPQRPQQELSPNLQQNPRPQSRWNSRRRIGQQRRILNRPRGRLLTPARPLPDSTNPRSQTAAPATDQVNMQLPASPTTPLALSPTRPPSPPVSLTHGISLSKSASPSLTPSSSAVTSLSPPHTNIHIDTVNHSAKTPDTARPTLSNAQTTEPTHSHTAITQTREPHTHTWTNTLGSGRHTKTSTALDKRADGPPSKHNEEPWMNLSGGPYESLSSHSPPPTSSPVISSTAHSATINGKIQTTPSVTLESAHPASSDKSSTSTTTATGHTFPTTARSTLNSTTMPTTTAIIIPTPGTTRSTTVTTSSTTTTTTTTPFMTSTKTTTSSTRPSTTDFSTTTTTTTTSLSTIISIKAVPTTRIPTTPTTKTTPSTSSSRLVISTTTTANAAKSSTSPTPTMMKSTSSTASSDVDVGTGRRPVSGGPNQSQPAVEWKNSATNFIPDSHSSRPHWLPSLPLPAAPGVSSSSIMLIVRAFLLKSNVCNVSALALKTLVNVVCAAPHIKIFSVWLDGKGMFRTILQFNRVSLPHNQHYSVQRLDSQRIQHFQYFNCFRHNDLASAVRSGPRIADPHNRTVSFPAESTARMACDAQGEPKPSITWTRIAAGTHSAASSNARFEVLPNGTLVIQNVQLQDRGTYICSAHSVIGRDRLLTTLEVWTRRPRMQLASYREATIHQGGEVQLECRADGVPGPLLSWVLPDRSVLTSTAPPTGRITVDKNGTLHIAGTLPSDRGVYRCEASNSAGAVSASARVHVSSLPPVIQQPREEHLLLNPGWPVYAHCSARGAPPPTLRWRIPDGTLVRPSQFLHGNLFVLPNGTLHIRGVGPKESGNYECIASNAVGADKRTVRVKIQGKAHIVSTSPSITTVHYGFLLQLHCSVTGNPSPIIIWRTPNRKLVDMHFSFDRRLKVHTNGTLSVQRVTEKDAGDYLCIARNKVSDDYRLLRVSVATKPAKIEPKQPPTQMVSLGQPLKVDCQASGLPDPAVQWSLPDGTMVNSVLQREDRGGQAQMLTVFDNGTLLVPTVGMGEEGDYTCYAENQGGQDTMKVKVKVMIRSPPNFSDDGNYHVIKVRLGATATIRCQATGVPAPTVTWFSPTGRVIPRSLEPGFYTERVVATSDGTLEVRLAQKIDKGNYTCRASSSAGEKSMVVGLEMEAPDHGVSGRVGGTVLGVLTSAKQRAVKGQIVLLPCPSQGSPPPRLAWLLPGNRVLPAPHYGNRLIVHRNGSLELRGVRASDGGTFACVVSGEREQIRIQVELEVSDPQDEATSPHGGAAVERPVQESRLVDVPRSGASLLSAQSLNSTLHSRISVTREPPLRAQSRPDFPPPVGPPPRTTSPVSKPALSTRTAPLVSIVNGETLRLPCYASNSLGGHAGTFSWITPTGKVLSLGQSGDKYLVQEDGTLTVQQASVFDRGTYTCRSTSVDASSVSVTTVPVIVIAYPPRITAGPSPVTYTRPGVAVELRCQTIATPRATITWETPELTQLRVTGQARIHGNRYLSPQGSMVINNPTRRDTGFYRCTAKNVLGVDTQATYLHVI
uniref:Ig-like domain-containing protein n=1 Tax=Gasterosteus aculeatus TaxID=69293 RepID=G3NSN7_GASAC